MPRAPACCRSFSIPTAASRTTSSTRSTCRCTSSFAAASTSRRPASPSASGLARQRQLNANGEDERIYLDRLEELVRHGKSQGRLLAERWAGEWHQDIQKLIAHTSYRLPIAA